MRFTANSVRIVVPAAVSCRLKYYRNQRPLVDGFGLVDGEIFTFSSGFFGFRGLKLPDLVLKGVKSLDLFDANSIPVASLFF